MQKPFFMLTNLIIKATKGEKHSKEWEVEELAKMRSFSAPPNELVARTP